ncbi:1-acyl-sn-glycerol-3-phosphate acyltransferase [Eggerthella sp. YY7918]|nr:1-acyl-sn-glycerol-3-phosphate acyltransferase [Eggerthella sp. YY7918]
MPYEKMWDMPLGGTSTEKQMPHWSGNLIWGFLSFVFKICFRYRVDCRENIRGFNGKSGVVVVANHTSYLDVAFMYLATRPQQWVRFMGRENLFGKVHGLVGQILSRVGAFPIKRDAADRTAIKRATRMLKNNEIVGIMPEGTRRGKSGRTPEIHSGAAFIAKMGKAPILPMTVRNAENVKHKGERFHFPKITIEYGNPVLVSDFDFLPKEDRLDGCAWYAMRECFALSARVPREQVDMVALFPGGKDFTTVFAEHPIPEHTTAEVVAQIETKKAAPSVITSEANEAATSSCHPERSAQREVEGSPAAPADSAPSAIGKESSQ